MGPLDRFRVKNNGDELLYKISGFYGPDRHTGSEVSIEMPDSSSSMLWMDSILQTENRSQSYVWVGNRSQVLRDMFDRAFWLVLRNSWENSIALMSLKSRKKSEQKHTPCFSFLGSAFYSERDAALSQNRFFWLAKRSMRVVNLFSSKDWFRCHHAKSRRDQRLSRWQ